MRAPDPFYWVTGVVRDGAGTPLAGVQVTIGAGTVTTGPDGAYRLRAQPGANSLGLAMPDAAAAGMPADWTSRDASSAPSPTARST